MVSIDGGFLVIGLLAKNTKNCIVLKDPRAITMMQGESISHTEISSENFLFSSFITIYRSYIAIEVEERHINNDIIKAYIELGNRCKIITN